MDNAEIKEPTIGRNEPCPCKSGKKYKRCCGVSAAPKLGVAKAPDFGSGAFGGMPSMGGAGGPGGLPFDPSQLDPQWMMQFTNALQRLPRGQMQRLQAMMQKAMAGKDVSKEAAEFERTLPPEFKSLLSSFQMPAEMASMMGGAVADAGASSGEAGGTEPAAPMTEDRAREIVQTALAEGKISQEQADALLGAAAAAQGSPDSDQQFGLGGDAADEDITDAEIVQGDQNDSHEQASTLSSEPSSGEPSTEATAMEAGNESEREKKSGISKLWRSLTGKS